MVIPMQQDGGGKSVDEYITELTAKTYTFNGKGTSLITFPETGIYLVVLPFNHPTIAGRTGCEFIINPTVVVSNSSTASDVKSSYTYALVRSNQANSSWRTDAYKGASGETSDYILAKLMDL